MCDNLGGMSGMGDTHAKTINVFLADDNLIVREGVRALIERHKDLSVVGVASDFDGTVAGRARPSPTCS